MNLKILGQDYILPSAPGSLEQIKNIVYQMAADRSLIFNGLVIDGEVVREDPFTYLEERLAEVKQVEALLESETVYVDELLREFLSVLRQGIPQIIDIGRLFYRHSPEIWAEMDSFLEVMDLLMQIYQEMEAFPHILNERYKKLDMRRLELERDKFTGLIVALNQVLPPKDTVAIGDLMIYELVPSLQVMENILARGLKGEKKVAEFGQY
jgi:hypothetical protein